MKPITTRLLIALVALSTASLACSIPVAGTAATSTAAPVVSSATAAPTLPPQSTAAPTTAPTLPQPTKAPAPTVTTPPMVNQVTVYFIAVNDGGKSGPAVGCGDSLVAVNRPVTPTSQPIQAALQELFSVKDQFIGQSGLYNALYQSNLVVESVSVQPSGLAEVALTGTMLLGGVCDSPRFKAQLEQTIMAQPGISAANVTINGKTLDQVLSEK